MATIRRALRIEADPEAPWGIIGNPGAIHEWFPGITASQVDADDDGPFRTVTLGTGLQLVERIITNDPVLRRFQYRIEGGLFKQHLGTADVIDLRDGTCLLVYSTDAEPAVLALVIGAAAGDGLHNIAALCGAPIVGDDLGPQSPVMAPSITTDANGAN